MRVLSSLFFVTMLAACASPTRDKAFMTEASLVDPTALQQMGAGDYRIGAGDKLRLTVFQVEGLTFEEIRVDASGNLQLPLIGSVRAAGMTPASLSEDLQQRLGQRYLRNPQVSVIVNEAANQKITVDGAVTKPGVYEMRGQTSLVQAIAMAEGASRVADVKEVAVFRTIDGRRHVALFNLQAIRNGQASDPLLQGDDIVVVDTSRMSAAWRDLIVALPAFSAFAYLR